MTLRLGIAGCGFIGAVHAFVLGAIVEAGLVDVVVSGTHDVDGERATRVAEPLGARPYADLHELVTDVDVVWVCTWTAAHRPVVAAAVERGRAVFCEKPLAPSLPECEEVARLLTRVPHRVGLVLRNAPVFEAAAEAISSGRHGRPLAAVMRDDQFFPNQGRYGSDWRADIGRAGGGTLLEHSIHDVDVLTWLLGPPLTARAEVASRFGHAGIDDVAVVDLGFDGGAHATLVSVWHQILSRGSNRRLEVFCEDALLWADDDYLGPLHVETTTGESVLRAEPPEWARCLEVPAEHLAPVAQYAEQALAFLEVLTGDAAPRPGPDAETALAAHRVVDAAYRSAAAGGLTTRVTR